MEYGEDNDPISGPVRSHCDAFCRPVSCAGLSHHFRRGTPGVATRGGIRRTFDFRIGSDVRKPRA